MDEEDESGWDGRHNAPLCVTLDKKIQIPGPNHTPAATAIFRAEDWSKGKNRTTFIGLNIGPDNSTVEIKNDNILSVAIIGNLP